ncbi:MAG: DUF1214 domain-containing protein [Aestuariivirga sp.]
MARVSVKIFSVLCGVVGGWASALSLIDSVGSSPAGAAGTWRMWDLAAGTASNPYARAHFLMEGRVPPAQSLFQVYTNSLDDEGDTLRSGCTYRVAANDLESRWWSLSVGPSNSEDRDSSAAVTSDEVVRGTDNSLSVTVARSPVAGNWIRPATEGTLILQLVVSNTDELEAAGDLKLPSVKRVSC